MASLPRSTSRSRVRAMTADLTVISALCRIIEQAAEIIESEQTRKALLAEMDKAVGEDRA